MKQTLTIASRELSALFYSPVAYLVLSVFALVSSLFFLGSFYPGDAATMRGVMGALVFILVFITPAISMRVVSEEWRGGTMELLMTAPISDAQVAIGKWLGTLAFYAALLLPVLFQIVVLEFYADPDYGPIFTGLLGLLLVGGLYLAIGVFISATTDSQLVAYIITVLIVGFLSIGMQQLPAIEWLPNLLREAMSYVNVFAHFDAFGKGLIDIRNFVFFLSTIALFLFFAAKTLESRRWR